MDCSLPGSSIHGISQARIPKCIPFSRGSSWPKRWALVSCIAADSLPLSLQGSSGIGTYAHSLSCVQLFATPGTVARQAPQLMEFSRQEYWRGLSFPTPRYISDLGIKPTSFASPTLAGEFFTTIPLGKPLIMC